MDFKDLAVYKKAFELSMKIFEISKSFPKEETYALTDQIRRSSRSVCANIAEAYRKRIYPAHFISKASDADMENAETQVWISFSLACGYITESQFKELMDYSAETSMILKTKTRMKIHHAISIRPIKNKLFSDEIGKLINHIIKNPEKYV
jgi:four helix bundle protein